ncbi:hypothetical protein ABEB36_008094 [Hypothenemus hampei]|uniref:Large ribosomal subunit protein uL10m n=1 Tax=Hypothenemus hampei TaxID=57062 RepID=A0ABD1EKS2_HYPHA
MALLVKKATCVPITPLIQIKRYRGKINITKPKPPHFEKAKYLALTKPWFLPQKKGKPLVELCDKDVIPTYKKIKEERNIYQEIIAKELYERIYTSRFVAFCHLNPITYDTQYDVKVLCHKEGMSLQQFGKKTMELAVKGTPYETILDFYISRNVTIFSPEPKVKRLLQILKRFPQVVLLAGIYENKLLNKDELVNLSKIPNLQAAQSELVHTLSTVASQLVNNLNSHQTNLVSHLEQRANQLEET